MPAQAPRLAAREVVDQPEKTDTGEEYQPPARIRHDRRRGRDQQHRPEREQHRTPPVVGATGQLSRLTPLASTSESPTSNRARKVEDIPARPLPRNSTSDCGVPTLTRSSAPCS